MTLLPALTNTFDGLKAIIEVIGVDHVSIGSDQHVSPRSMHDYTQWVHLVGAILGGTSEEAGKIVGGDYMHIFRAAVG